MPFDKEPTEDAAPEAGFEAMMKSEAVGRHRSKNKPPDDDAGLEIELGDEEGEMGGESEAVSQLSAELGLSPEQAKQAYDIVCKAMGM